MNRKAVKGGSLPEGWREVRLGDVSVCSKGSGITKNELVENGVPCVRYGELYTRHNFRILNFYSFIDDKNLDKRKLIRNNDLLFAGSGETRKEIGKCASFNHNIKAYAGGDVIVFSINPKKLRADFASYYLNTIGRKQITKFGQGDSIVHIYGRFLKDIKILLPPLSDQKEIAILLATWDTAIEKTEALIAAKQKQFKWLLQTLISDQQNNPEWRRVKLKEMLEYEQPTKYIVASTNYTDEGLVPVLTANKSFILGYTKEKDGIFNKYPIIIFDDFTTANRYVDFPFKIKSSAIKILKRKNNLVNMEFVYHAMKFIDFPLGGHQRYWISEYQQLDIGLPNLVEQRKIVTMLNIAQKNMDVLRLLAEQYRIQKRGLMQKLLTGKWRVGPYSLARSEN